MGAEGEKNPINQYNHGRETDLALQKERGGKKLIFYELISSWFS
jgi:hypothetical protein